MTEKQFFPKAPDWNKVQDVTTSIIDMINKRDLSYTEKYAVLSLVKSSVDSEFNVNSIIHWMQHEYNEEQNKINDNTYYQ